MKNELNHKTKLRSSHRWLQRGVRRRISDKSTLLTHWNVFQAWNPLLWDKFQMLLNKSHLFLQIIYLTLLRDFLLLWLGFRIFFHKWTSILFFGDYEPPNDPKLSHADGRVAPQAR